MGCCGSAQDAPGPTLEPATSAEKAAANAAAESLNAGEYCKRQVVGAKTTTAAEGDVKVKVVESKLPEPAGDVDEYQASEAEAHATQQDAQPTQPDTKHLRDDHNLAAGDPAAGRPDQPPKAAELDSEPKSRPDDRSLAADDAPAGQAVDEGKATEAEGVSDVATSAGEEPKAEGEALDESVTGKDDGKVKSVSGAEAHEIKAAKVVAPRVCDVGDETANVDAQRPEVTPVPIITVKGGPDSDAAGVCVCCGV